MTHFDQISSSLKTGDLLFWAGTGLISRAIQLGQHIRYPHEAARISHVGMVLRGVDLFEATSARFYLSAEMHRHSALTFESTTLNEVPDIITGKQEKGVSLVSLRDKLHRYDGRLWVRRLQHVDRDHFRRQALQYIERTHGTGYERKPWQLLASAFGLRRGLWGEDASSLFCSETVTDLYEHAGVLDEKTQDADAMCPAEVWQLNDLLLPPVRLGEPVEVVI